MCKNKACYNPFDDFLFWLDFVSIDFGRGLNEIPKKSINNNSPKLNNIGKPVLKKSRYYRRRKVYDS
jgi:hypothetical protein